MKPSRLSALAGIAALAALGGCAPHTQPAPDPYAQPGTYGAYPQSAAGSYGQYGGAGAYGTVPAGYPGTTGTYGTSAAGAPSTDAAYGAGTYGTGYAGTAGYPNAPQAAYAAPNAYGNGYANGAAYGQPNANGYYARGNGQYPPPSTFDVRQPYYGDGGYHLMGTYNDGESHPLRLVSFAVAPVGYLAEWLVARPIHRVVAQQDMAPIFSYTPQAGFDYETYEEGLSTGVTFEEPQSLD